MSADAIRQKVIKGLECCGRSLFCPDDCPYQENFDNGCPAQLAQDVLAVLFDKDSRRALAAAEDAEAPFPAHIGPRELLLHTWGHGWQESHLIGDDEDPECFELAECVWINGHIMDAEGSDANAEFLLGKRIGGGSELTDYLYLLAPAVPLMLVDHVTDAVLRGIGEQVYSMFVNIADSLLSILLVALLLPPLGARGYTTVILLAEIFNLSLSLGRLAQKTGVCIDLLRALLPPLLLGLLALSLSLPLDLLGLVPILAAAVGAASVVYALRIAERERKDAALS